MPRTALELDLIIQSLFEPPISRRASARLLVKRVTDRHHGGIDETLSHPRHAELAIVRRPLSSKAHHRSQTRFR